MVIPKFFAHNQTLHQRPKGIRIYLLDLLILYESEGKKFLILTPNLLIFYHTVLLYKCKYIIGPIVTFCIPSGPKNSRGILLFA